MEDFDIDVGISNSDYKQFYSSFNLKSLMKKETCITKIHKSTIDKF